MSTPTQFKSKALVSVTNRYLQEQIFKIETNNLLQTADISINEIYEQLHR